MTPPAATDNAFAFASKATTLERLAPAVRSARFCEQICIAVGEWRTARAKTLDRILSRFGDGALAIRSSAASEDGWESSQAGAHLSLIGVEPEFDAVAHAVDAVFASYRIASDADQVLVQPVVCDAVISGVVLSRDLDTGSPYYVVSYDDFSGRTDTVTAGLDSKTILVHRARPDALRSARFRTLIDAVQEIERVTGSHELDIEFCITAEEAVFILQVRPLAARRRWSGVTDEAIDAALDAVRADLGRRMRPVEGLSGATTIFGEMPDWNPAEMIGNTPRPLALSLYRRLITDAVWAEGRAAMGYRRVEAPLMVDFHGRPYIDVRLSLNSFLPAGIAPELADRLVDHQLAVLCDRRELHDRIEFEIALTCRDLAFGERIAALREAGFANGALDDLGRALGTLTRNAVAQGADGFTGLLARTESLLAPSDGGDGDAPATARAARLLERCAEAGTLPFAMLARHGFIAVSFLRSLVARGALSPEDAERFMLGIDTVATDLVRAMNALADGRIGREAFLSRFGHLRPGTYDITSWRYDERPDLFLAAPGRPADPAHEPFRLGADQERATARLLDEAGYDFGPEALFGYIRDAIAARERAKFAFTRSVSDALAMLAGWGEGIGLSRDDLSFLAVGDILSAGRADALREDIARAREDDRVTRALRLPHLLAETADIDVVRLPLDEPSFITGKSVTAPVKRLEANQADFDIDGHIVLIESADPGFDWIFSHRIAGLVTRYGGANSHMAIRSAEFGLPAAIGCGERLFETLARAGAVELNCASRKIAAH